MLSIPTRQASVSLVLALAVICLAAFGLKSGTARSWLTTASSAQAGVVEIELPELRVAPTTQPELTIASPNVNQINLHILRPQADEIDYGAITVKLNGEGTAGLYETRPSARGKLVLVNVKSLPGFTLVPGRNTVEVEATDRRHRRLYASFVLSTTSNRLKEFNYKTVAGTNPQQQTPPEIALLEPEREILFPAGRASFAAPISGVATATGVIERVTIDDKPVALKRGDEIRLRKFGLANELNRVAFEMLHTIAAGATSVTIVAADNFGNRTQLQIPVRAASGGAPQEFRGQKYALIVGVSAFQHQNAWIKNLRFADADARALHAFLQTPGGGRFAENNMLLLTNEGATLARFREALKEFVTKPGPDDLLFIFLATHGGPDVQAQQNLYFVLHDTKYDALAATGMAMKDLQTFLQQNVRAKRLLLMVDTCQSAGLLEAPTVATRGANNLANLYVEKLLFNEEGKAVLTAADVNESSLESARWGGGHGVFTHFLLEGLRGDADANRDRLVTLGELFRFVRQRVRMETQFNQTPRLLIGTNENLKLAAVTKSR